MHSWLREGKEQGHMDGSQSKGRALHPRMASEEDESWCGLAEGHRKQEEEHLHLPFPSVSPFSHLHTPARAPSFVSSFLLPLCSHPFIYSRNNSEDPYVGALGSIANFHLQVPGNHGVVPNHRALGGNFPFALQSRESMAGT